MQSRMTAPQPSNKTHSPSGVSNDGRARRLDRAEGAGVFRYTDLALQWTADGNLATSYESLGDYTVSPPAFTYQINVYASGHVGAIDSFRTRDSLPANDGNTLTVDRAKDPNAVVDTSTHQQIYTQTRAGAPSLWGAQLSPDKTWIALMNDAARVGIAKVGDIASPQTVYQRGSDADYYWPSTGLNQFVWYQRDVPGQNFADLATLRSHPQNRGNVTSP